MSEHRNEIPERTLRLFPSTYLTLISIIQGVAFSTFIVVTLESEHTRSWAWWVMVTVVALVFLTVWSEYMLSTMVFAWIPTPVDSATPFVLGFLELALMDSVDPRQPAAFFFWLLAFSLGGCIAYSNYFLQARRQWLAHARYAAFRAHVTSGALMTLCAALIYLGIFLVARAHPGHDDLSIGVLALVGASPLVAIIGRTWWTWNKPMRAASQLADRHKSPY